MLTVRYRTDRIRRNCYNTGRMEAGNLSRDLGCVNAAGNYVVIDFRRCESHRFSEVYQDFGVLCTRMDVRRALLKTGDEEADIHYALLDILRAVVLVVETPLHLKLALVSRSDAVTLVYRAMQKELRVLGCDAGLFRFQPQAEGWLRASASGSRRRAGPAQGANADG